ncbi:MAG TPA: DUF1707 and FHA domain-containing protein [Trebonia sp.]|nr:DUF1707 and FHA domain-containing protein [Trebonia sp.]
MGGSAAEAPTTPDAEPVGRIRASDAERDEVLARLREEFVVGRLSHDTFLIRLDAVLQARHLSDLPPLLADLEPAVAEPAPGGPPGPGPARLGPPALPHSLVPEPSPAGAGGPAGPAWPEPDMPGTVAPYPAERRGGVPFPSAGQPSLARRLRAALDRWLRPPAPRRPLPLQFPRGSGKFFSIGRNDRCDLAIADVTVSRVHATLERTDDGWLLTDLGSTNGTRVNGWLVREHVPVTAGDLVSFGKAEFWLTADQGS